MSRYAWPSPGPVGDRDDPAARGAWNARRHLGLGLEGALAASRATPRPRRGGPGPFAPGVGRQYRWQPLGPATILDGQAEGRPRVSGRVNALAVHPDGERVYAASANGGVWYSADGGASWTSVGGLAATNTAGIVRPAQRNACGALLVAWGATPGEDLVFVGTGEVANDMDAQPGSPEGGLGIFVGDKPVLAAADVDPWEREAPNLANTGVYNLAREPGTGRVVAATRIGLFERPAVGGKDVPWTRPAGAPFDTLATACTDVLWTPAAAGGVPPRLWVYVRDGTHAGLWVREAGATTFTKVAVPTGAAYGFNAARASLAASSPPTHVWVFNDRGATLDPGLFRVTNPPSGTAPEAHPVVGVPHVLHDQGFYDIAVAVDPGNVNRVALAGSWWDGPTLDGAQAEYNASIVVGEVAADPAAGGALTYGHPAPWTHVGVGVHADVHALVYSNGGTRLWAGCDGGVFRSDRPLRPAGFYPRNAGFSISESNFLGCHPRCEGSLVVGLQDNGTIERLSSSVWRMRFAGDGGGVVLNPLNPAQYLAQYVRGDWNHTAGGTGPLVRGTVIWTGERDAAAFYSMGASIAHVRTPPAPAPPVPLGQVLVGTDRPWFSDDFGATWRTLPTGTDPLTPTTANVVQDRLGGTVTTCRWQSPDVAWLLLRRTLVRLSRKPGSHDDGSAGEWKREYVMPTPYVPPPPHAPAAEEGKEKKRDAPPPAPGAPPAPPSPRAAAVWTDVMPNMEGAAPRGTLGAVYVGTIGHETNAAVDTLWWFDGTGGWHPTGLRAAVPAPVVAIACDPATPNEVWVGTTVGVWQGARTVPPAGPPTWAWTQRVNGLPEAAVEDLQIVHDGDLVLLRAAIAARGVWELRLDQPDLQDLTYLRAHADDLRHRVGGPPASPRRAVDVQRDLTTPRSWHGSPDVRPRVAPHVIPTPTSLPWSRGKVPAGATEALRRFQAALRSKTGDPRVVANGRWDTYFSEVLRDHGAPTVAVPATATTPALSGVRITAAFWNGVMTGAHRTAEPWGAGPPTEADLYELVSPDGVAEGELGRRSCVMPRRPLRVDVVVHRRGTDPIAGEHVRVTLLRWVDESTPRAANPDAVATWPSAAVPWTAAVNEVLNSPDGRTTLPLGDGWSFCEGATSADPRRRVLTGQTLDPLRPGVATFAVDFTPLRRHRLVLLVAVVRAGTTAADDIALAATPLQDLVMTSPHVAVRSVAVG